MVVSTRERLRNRGAAVKPTPRSFESFAADVARMLEVFPLPWPAVPQPFSSGPPRDFGSVRGDGARFLLADAALAPATPTPVHGLYRPTARELLARHSDEIRRARAAGRAA